MLFALFLAAAIPVGNPPPDCARMRTEESPRHTFTVEEYSYDPEGTAVWLRGRDGRVAQLYARPGSIIAPYVYISPDERWIVCVQKLYHRASAAWLYERTAALTYGEVPRARFSDLAWDFFRSQTRVTLQSDDTLMISTGTWLRQSRSLLVELTGDDGRTFVRSWFCYYDLEKHRFYIDDTLRKKNQNAVSTQKET